MAGSDWREFEFSSGVVALYGPFPHGMYWELMEKWMEKHPDPPVPTKVIEVLGGTEEVDDTEDPVYQVELASARRARYALLTEAALDLCVEVKGWPGRWASTLERLTSKYGVELPEDDDDRRVWFLNKYAIRTPRDWGIVRLIQSFSQIEDEEVRRKAESFPGDVEGPEGPGADAPGPAEEQRVAVLDEGEGPDGG